LEGAFPEAGLAWGFLLLGPMGAALFKPREGDFEAGFEPDFWKGSLSGMIYPFKIEHIFIIA
jgi:hypothetical protein